MSEQTKTELDQARLRKLDLIEELAEGVNLRWRRVGLLSRLEADVKELLLAIKRSPVRVKKPRKASKA